MVIDIVSYTTEQFAAMKTANLQKICNAQLKKNALLKALERDILEAKERLVNRGAFTSTIFESKKAELTAACNVEIESVRAALLFSLRYAGATSGDSAAEDAPYSVDYALSEEDRMLVVKAYYEDTYTDATERFNAFVADAFARSYLGEMYAPLYHYFEGLI